MKKTIAIVNQRYGLEVNGGSELYTRQIAEKLSAKYDVEILTTCAMDYVKWSNYYKEGTELINGIKVRRFKVEHERNPKVFSHIDASIQNNPAATTKEQYDTWLEEQGPYCPKLINYLYENQNQYDVIIVVTYLYYTAVQCLRRIKNKILFIPTAHQEPYIHFKLFEEVFASPRAYVFLTEEEKNLVATLFPVRDKIYEIMGVGIDIPDCVDEEDFKKKYSLDEYVVYVGRIDLGKNCPTMFDYFLEYKKRNHNNIKLVLMGKAVVKIPDHEDIINLGFVSDQDKFNGIKGAKALILPSKFESLSISVLEAMALGVPVIVNGACDVLKGHCLKSNGALYYNNYFEFEGCLNYMQSHIEEYKTMCLNAKKYVKEYFDWNIIINKFDKIIDKITN